LRKKADNFAPFSPKGGTLTKKKSKFSVLPNITIHTPIDCAFELIRNEQVPNFLRVIFGLIKPKIALKYVILNDFLKYHVVGRKLVKSEGF
jgi:hypothetical protein